MLRKGLYVVLMISLVFGVGFFSGCRPHGHHRGAEFAVDYVTEVLDLTETQQQQLNQIKDELMAKREQMRAKKAEHHDEIVELLLSEQIDKTRVNAIIAEHRAQMDEMINLMVVQFIDFHSTLSAEQKAKLVKKLEGFHKWHQNGG